VTVVLTAILLALRYCAAPAYAPLAVPLLYALGSVYQDDFATATGTGTGSGSGMPAFA